MTTRTAIKRALALTREYIYCVITEGEAVRGVGPETYYQAIQNMEDQLDQYYRSFQATIELPTVHPEDAEMMVRTSIYISQVRNEIKNKIYANSIKDEFPTPKN